MRLVFLGVFAFAIFFIIIMVSRRRGAYTTKPEMSPPARYGIAQAVVWASCLAILLYPWRSLSFASSAAMSIGAVFAAKFVRKRASEESRTTHLLLRAATSAAIFAFTLSAAVWFIFNFDWEGD